jgi:P27 family predicted phage terminase small subunit
MRGRKPKPEALRVLEGRTGGRYHQDKDRERPKPTLGVGNPPAWLQGEALAEWHRIVPELERVGLVTALDQTTLAVYCETFGLWRQATAVVNEHGPTITSARGVVRVRPEHRIAQRALDAMRQWSAEFGLTPTSRGRLTVPKPVVEDENWGGLLT